MCLGLGLCVCGCEFWICKSLGVRGRVCVGGGAWCVCGLVHILRSGAISRVSRLFSPPLLSSLLLPLHGRPEGAEEGAAAHPAQPLAKLLCDCV
jgi:hypothetical protein